MIPLLDWQNYSNSFQAFIGLPYPRLDNPLIYEDDTQIDKNFLREDGNVMQTSIVLISPPAPKWNSVYLLLCGE